MRCGNWMKCEDEKKTTTTQNREWIIVFSAPSHCGTHKYTHICTYIILVMEAGINIIFVVVVVVFAVFLVLFSPYASSSSSSFSSSFSIQICRTRTSTQCTPKQLIHSFEWQNTRTNSLGNKNVVWVIEICLFDIIIIVIGSRFECSNVRMCNDQKTNLQPATTTTQQHKMKMKKRCKNKTEHGVVVIAAVSLF